MILVPFLLQGVTANDQRLESELAEASQAHLCGQQVYSVGCHTQRLQPESDSSFIERELHIVAAAGL
jgi:hypothetical protein